jgi:hypothetical protein
MQGGDQSEMLRKISDSINHCVKCDDENKYLIWAFNHDLILEPVCWRCFERADKHLNTKSGWKRKHRNLNPVWISQFDRRQKDNRSRLRLVRGSETEMRQKPATASRASAASYQWRRAA